MDLGNVLQRQDLVPEILEMWAMGVSLVRCVTQETFRKDLVEEIFAEPFDIAHETIGPVRQDLERFAFFRCVEGMPRLELFRVVIERLVCGVGTDLDDWRARDVVVQRYGNAGGVSAHRDLKRNPDVIAIYNLAGSATFELLNGRDGDVVIRYEPQPGDLILLRGAARGADDLDLRPFHWVHGAIGAEPRISVTFRDNNNPGKPISGFRYRNFKWGGD